MVAAHTMQIRALVLLSGGMDSCVCAALAVKEFSPQQVAALHVSYGQRTEARERKAFDDVCNALRIRERKALRNQLLGEIGGSALTDRNIAVPTVSESVAADGVGSAARPTDERTASEIPVTYVPFRNAHFLAAAVSWAEVLGAEKIFIGAVEQDSSGYPDCRPEYYRAFNEVVRAGTKEGKIHIVTPLIGLRKWEIIRTGLELRAPLDLTWSCYSESGHACGVCDSCVLRLRAFQQAGVSDPIPYARVHAPQ